MSGKLIGLSLALVLVGGLYDIGGGDLRYPAMDYAIGWPLSWLF